MLHIMWDPNPVKGEIVLDHARGPSTNTKNCFGKSVGSLFCIHCKYLHPRKTLFKLRKIADNLGTLPNHVTGKERPPLALSLISLYIWKPRAILVETDLVSFKVYCIILILWFSTVFPTPILL